VKRICKKTDRVSTYGAVDFGTLSALLLELFVDLKFRGDYSSTARKFLQKRLSQGNVSTIKTFINDRSKWSQVPIGRFNTRSKFVSSIPNPTAVGVTP
jgi:hypothetical protein